MKRLGLFTLTYSIISFALMTTDASAKMRKKKIVIVAFNVSEVQLINHATPEELMRNPALAAGLREEMRAKDIMGESIPESGSDRAPALAP